METFIRFLERKKSGRTYDYSSVLYLLPTKIADKIYQWGLDNVAQADVVHDPEDPTFGREKEIHCTVLYGIHDKKPDETKKLLRNVNPFEIKLGKVTAFTTSEKSDVLKVDVVGSSLHTLHHMLCNNLEVTKSYPEYRPHVTIAYLNKGKSDKYVGSDIFEGAEIEVDKVVFSSSEGVKSFIYLR